MRDLFVPKISRVCSGVGTSCGPGTQGYVAGSILSPQSFLSFFPFSLSFSFCVSFFGLFQSLHHFLNSTFCESTSTTFKASCLFAPIDSRVQSVVFLPIVCPSISISNYFPLRIIRSRVPRDTEKIVHLT